MLVCHSKILLRNLIKKNLKDSDYIKISVKEFWPINLWKSSMCLGVMLYWRNRNLLQSLIVISRHDLQEHNCQTEPQCPRDYWSEGEGDQRATARHKLTAEEEKNLPIENFVAEVQDKILDAGFSVGKAL